MLHCYIIIIITGGVKMSTRKRIKVKPKVEEYGISIDECFDLWLENIKMRNLRKATMARYTEVMHMWDLFMDIKEDIVYLNEEKLYEFKNWLYNSRNCCESSVVCYLKGTKTFLNFAKKQEIVDSKVDIEVKSVPKEAKEGFTDAEAKVLLAKPKTNRFTELITYTSFTILATTGIRLSSLISIQIKDIDYDGGIILVKQQKTSQKPQKCVMTKETKKAIISYLRVRGGEPDDYLICNIYGEKTNNSTFNKMSKSYALARNVNKWQAHNWRRYFCKTLIKSGISPIMVAKLMNHNDISLLTLYTHMTDEDMKDVIEKHNPLAKLESNKRKWIK
jgi:integrase/recombinase XerD